MSIFGKIKQVFGVGTVKVQIETEPTFKTEDGILRGKVNITGKSDQEITDVTIKFEESYSTGTLDNKSSTNIMLGETKLAGTIIKSGQMVSMPFELPFYYGKSKNEAMADKGGLMGGLGKINQFTNGERSTFKIIATADVKGAALDPNDIKTIKRVK